jgi:DNA-repair protein XRCC4
MELTWKKHILTNNVKFLLGSVTLNICREQGAIQLLDFAVSALEENQQEIGDLQKENHRLASERQGALARLDKCANLQQDIEKDLFGKFKVVLNEKKAKIRRLMEQLSNVSTQLSQLQQSVKQSASKPAAPLVTDGSGTEKHKGRGEAKKDQNSDYETDDEMIHSPSPMVTAKHAPSTPPLRPPGGPGHPVESLLGDPNEREISSPPVKRRRRHVGATSKVKGQPVELPRPPSIGRSSSSMSSGKVRVRSTSSESKKSEESLESDDLLQLL